MVVEEEETIGHGGPGRDRGCAEGWRDGCVIDEIEPAVTRCGSEEEEHCIHQRAVLMCVECGRALCVSALIPSLRAHARAVRR